MGFQEIANMFKKLRGFPKERNKMFVACRTSRKEVIRGGLAMWEFGSFPDPPGRWDGRVVMKK